VIKSRELRIGSAHTWRHHVARQRSEVPAMSMPQPIFVALVGSTADVVRRAKRHLRLRAPGMGCPLLATLEPEPSGDIQPLAQVPSGRITLWVALDNDALRASMQRHHEDTQNPRYDRGFYDEHFPEPCLLVDFCASPAQSKAQLAGLAQRLVDAWHATS
jgi:hypothetical protein